jgi:hypothetical protein
MRRVTRCFHRNSFNHRVVEAFMLAGKRHAVWADVGQKSLHRLMVFVKLNAPS